jgi:hypothetical protein
MSIFGAIRDAIFGRAAAAPSAPSPGVNANVGAAQGVGWTAGAADAAAQPQGGAVSAPLQPVDVDAKLRELMAAKGNPDLNYQSSIVDLMKLLDLDSSLAARSQLAEELGYTGARDGSAEMNIWLHRKVVEELEKNGGRVPDSMKS